MIAPPMASISRVSFRTDMTRGEAGADIPLGFMLEAVWPNRARWLGLIGRRRLTNWERGAINLQTWPELENPFQFLEQLFERGWSAPWSEAGHTIRDAWFRSALSVSIDDDSASLKMESVSDDAAWVATTSALDARLTALGLLLAPIRILPPPPPEPDVLVPHLSLQGAQGRKILADVMAAA